MSRDAHNPDEDRECLACGKKRRARCATCDPAPPRPPHPDGEAIRRLVLTVLDPAGDGAADGAIAALSKYDDRIARMLVHDCREILWRRRAALARLELLTDPDGAP